MLQTAFSVLTPWTLLPLRKVISQTVAEVEGTRWFPFFSWTVLNCKVCTVTHISSTGKPRRGLSSRFFDLTFTFLYLRWWRRHLIPYFYEQRCFLYSYSNVSFILHVRRGILCFGEQNCSFYSQESEIVLKWSAVKIFFIASDFSLSFKRFDNNFCSFFKLSKFLLLNLWYQFLHAVCFRYGEDLTAVIASEALIQLKHEHISKKGTL